ncbi:MULTISPECIES: NADH-quinone oxidoreductase subunit A [unclassified Mucilaginibacter]|uniref:NADH-quinone oxidoreductase subunit A n=1 Tax=unclassified Mucilaginibacter TaxID=2617802 RepID=UPI002AC9818C|nr:MULTISPECIES: NADH-quinone oxidoreductase subunit A [unclassified Mucilaginibacter]MEB0263127.1 NADH-quinone oxidoreductase subunit A [Mucilaginibacter sp. 10I4]MEB0280253.1 NADH-quinone oxidoreductase subunit A [Mucilaginibacter sp. 10B2]MEB0300198.1 NADH-quinone oxidoreductase subunit A [Mucilaginibacter sp. 5C4]WPX25556.1 NADH-quinone oxidoreductase subunit A [Mucilaginibacter sp. 5C4]
MDDVAQISEFGKILIFLITGIVFIGGLFFVNRLLAPRNPNYEKLTTYECGEEPTGNAWLPFNSRFYVIALVFLLFDVEMVFVFPWATVFGNREIIATDSRWGWFSLIEMFIFLGILILGLAYVWVKGDLDWIKPKVTLPQTDARIPQNLYDDLNAQQGNFKVKEFSLEIAQPAIATAIATTTSAAEPRKPMFKPSFKKPANDA